MMEKKKGATKPPPRARKFREPKIIKNPSNRFLRHSHEIPRIVGSLEESHLLQIILSLTIYNEEKENKNYFRKNEYWTHFPVSEIKAKYLSCCSEYVISKALDRLVKSKLIYKDCFPQRYDLRTNWYRPNYEVLAWEHGFLKSWLRRFYGKK